VLSTTQTLEYWLKVNRNVPRLAQTRKLANLDRLDNSSVTATLYPAPAGGAEVLFYRVEGGGHAMPSLQFPIPRLLQRRLIGPQNRDMEGAQAAWSFLSRQRLNRF
jgi:polyhydroxybutyrate depolymerase